MLTAKDGQFFVSDWMRNRNTLEFLGIWEMVNNPTFNYGEFATVNLNNAIKLGNRKIFTSNLDNKGIFIFNISPSPSVGALRMPLDKRAQSTFQTFE